MTTVEVLAPVRLETRFIPPDERDDGVSEWMLRVRVYPDEFSIRRTVAPPSSAELDRLQEAVALLTAMPPIDEAAAFASFAAVVGVDRAFGLWRRCVTEDGAGGLEVDRSDESEPVSFAAHGPAGIPERLPLWLIHTDGSRELATVLKPDAAAIAADLDLALFEQDEVLEQLASGALPETWWLSYRRAVEVGLGVDLDVGATPPHLDALLVAGIGSTPAADLVDEHNAGNRLAILPTGTPTNTVAGEATADLGGHTDTLYPLLHRDAAAQSSAVAALSALSGRVAATAQPLLGGDHDHYGPGSLAVQAFWPVLWGRALRDVTGARNETELARWAIHHLAVEGPLPAIRIGPQPYGLLPTSTFGQWTGEPGDDLADLEQQILSWALPWCAGAAAAARGADRRVHDSDSEGLLAVLGAHAPSRHWRVRPVAELPLIQAWRTATGMPPMPASDWDLVTAAVWRQWGYPFAPIGPAAHPGAVPGPPLDEADDPALLRDLIVMQPEPLYFGRIGPLGLVGHLVRETLICARAIVGEAHQRLQNGDPVQLEAPLPLEDEDTYRLCVMRGSDDAVADLEAAADSNAHITAARFRDVQSALKVFADMWDNDPSPWFAGVLSALDTAAFRVDPWLLGVADRRLQRMISAGASFQLGAYGWVDAPTPHDPTLGRATLPAGPTKAGLLHSPSPTQALTAAILRDAAVRYPGEDRWRLEIDSAKVRAAIALGERVRLGVHPYEALGLEVERVTGDWDSVRILRTHYPLAPLQQLRRVCDGAAVLRAARKGALPNGLAADLADRLAPLDDVLDTYADLLVTDGVHALVNGRADLANAAMEGAAGLGAPPELRAIRTPRSASTVRVSTWVLLPYDGGGDNGDPLRVADPAFAALIDDYDAERMTVLLGGGEEQGVVASLTGGDYEGLPAAGENPSASEASNPANIDLRTAMRDDLETRLLRLRDLAQSDHDDLSALESDDPAAADYAQRWCVPDSAEPGREDVLAALAERLTATATMPPAAGGAGAGYASAVPDTTINTLRAMIRLLAGRPTLPVLPIVSRALLPTLRAQPAMDRKWLEIVAAVRPRLAPLQAHQLVRPWRAHIAAPQNSTDPWHPRGPVVVAYAPAALGDGQIAIAALDAWTDSVPRRQHATTAAFGFNAPKSRAPQAILLAVPPDPAQRLDEATLLDVVLQTREIVHARATRPQDRDGLPYATPTPLVHAAPGELNFLRGWPQ